MKINKSYLEQLIIEQMQLMESSENAQDFLSALLDIGARWELHYGETVDGSIGSLGYMFDEESYSERVDELPYVKEKSTEIVEFAKSKLSRFIGKYILIKTDDGGWGDIPFDFAFGRIASFPSGYRDVRLSAGENILKIALDNVGTGAPYRRYYTDKSSIFLRSQYTNSHSIHEGVSLAVENLKFLGLQRFEIEINDDAYSEETRGILPGGVEIRISEPEDLLSNIRDMGVQIPSSENEAIEVIREFAYSDEDMNNLYRRIFEGGFYGPTVTSYFNDLINQGMFPASVG